MKKIKENILDKYWGLAIRSRAKDKCAYCGSPANQPHHIFSRNNRNTRWDLDNGILLCYSHHTFNNQFSAHRTPVEFTYWLETYKGKPFINSLREKAQKSIQCDEIFKSKKLKELKCLKTT
jgi:hypothetical protein